MRRWDIERDEKGLPGRIRIGPEYKRRTQFHCSNPSGLCDLCNERLIKHTKGDYYCPMPADTSSPATEDGK